MLHLVQRTYIQMCCFGATSTFSATWWRRIFVQFDAHSIQLVTMWWSWSFSRTLLALSFLHLVMKDRWVLCGIRLRWLADASYGSNVVHAICPLGRILVFGTVLFAGRCYFGIALHISVADWIAWTESNLTVRLQWQQLWEFVWRCQSLQMHDLVNERLDRLDLFGAYRLDMFLPNFTDFMPFRRCQIRSLTAKNYVEIYASNLIVLDEVPELRGKVSEQSFLRIRLNQICPKPIFNSFWTNLCMRAFLGILSVFRNTKSVLVGLQVLRLSPANLTEPRPRF